MSEEEIVTKAVDDQLAQAISAIKERGEGVPPPSELFHFTDADGAIGIVGGGVLWASLSTALNDASEERYTVDLTLEFIRNGKITSSPFVLAVAAYLEDPTVIPQFATRINAFVVSFCSDADSAPQWLHYGREGRGCALCFDGEKLKAQHTDLIPILYDSAAQEQFVTSLIASAAARVHRDSRLLSPLAAKLLNEAVAHLVAQSIRVFVSVQFKAPAFRHENEWRLVTFDSDPDRYPEHLREKLSTELFYRSRNQRVVPFVKVMLPTPIPVTSIVLGHSNPMDVYEAALTLLWERHVDNSPRIRRSSVTVRP